MRATVCFVALVLASLASVVSSRADYHVAHTPRRHFGRADSLRKALAERQDAKKSTISPNNSSSHFSNTRHGAVHGNAMFKLSPNKKREVLKDPGAGKQFVTIFDQDGDGLVSLTELQFGLNFAWRDQQEADTARRVVDLPSPEDVIKHGDTDGDEALNSDEVQFLLDQTRQAKDGTPRDCSVIEEKVAKCKSRHVLRCGGYVNLAENACHLGYGQQRVDLCIMNSSCENVCACIDEVAKSVGADAEGNVTSTSSMSNAAASTVSTIASTATSEMSSSTASAITSLATGNHSISGTHQHEKRLLLPIFFGLVLVEIGELLTFALAEIVRSANELVAADSVSRFLDVKVWDPDSGNQPPSCATYIYWSQGCGAIGSGTAKGCKPDGGRLYSKSCVTHFNKGSKGCGFLKLGCKSLCFATNTAGCGCDLFDYEEFDDKQFPNHVYASYKVDQVSECAKKCTADSRCVAFEIPPLQKDIDTCLLKDGGDDAITLKGVTTFVKIGLRNGGEEDFCDIKADRGSDLPFGEDWGSGLPFSKRRNLSDRDASSVERGLDDARPKPHDLAFTYLIVQALWAALQRMYNNGAMRGDAFLHSDADNMWSTIQTPDVRPIGDPTLPRNINRGAAEPIVNRNGGRWSYHEIVQRIVNVHRQLINAGGVQPVLDSNAAGFTNVFPAALRNILMNNENTVRNAVNGQGNTNWYHQRTLANGKSIDPVTGIVVPYDANINFFQGGFVGPLTLEGAFILGTQLAGVDYARVQRSAQRANMQHRGLGEFSTSFILGRVQNARALPEDGCIGVPINTTTDRNLGRGSMNQQVPNDAYADAGVQIALELAMRSKMSCSSSRTGPIPEARNTRALAHAHVAILSRSEWQAYRNNGGLPPRYVQVGNFHFYLNPEDAPGQLRNNNQGGGANDGRDELRRSWPEQEEEVDDGLMQRAGATPHQPKPNDGPAFGLGKRMLSRFARYSRPQWPPFWRHWQRGGAGRDASSAMLGRRVDL
ncbi:EF-hand domain pair [Ceraceosorus bombacis]|uniref:EF-hand domain pair n=1 Tax=Ceraceosorus bombacis TaxID=401625 RepID=A0A0P1BME7_9BASI|nr:EF-hand domain pair [Ceraceosorus bombacis]